ncbi:MAG TPA: hypothetical protein PK609_01795 [Candidatus Paceibacterota bacterium]|nr:hypothetical protein [Candidatus Paceibacterota bacterium]
MSRSLILILLGALVALAPFSGLPLRILAWILPVFGVVAIAVGISYRTRVKNPFSAPAHEASTESLA